VQIGGERSGRCGGGEVREEGGGRRGRGRGRGGELSEEGREKGKEERGRGINGRRGKFIAPNAIP